MDFEIFALHVDPDHKAKHVLQESDILDNPKKLEMQTVNTHVVYTAQKHNYFCAVLLLPFYTPGA